MAKAARGPIEKGSTQDQIEPVFTSELWQRIIDQGRRHSVIEISSLRGFPDASAIYRELAANEPFGREFKKRSINYRRDRRAELADLIKRGQQIDLGRIFVALRKIRKVVEVDTAQQDAAYDLTLLSDAELEQLYAMLSKALPETSQPSSLLLMMDD